MDHGEKYWVKQSYEYQRSEIHLELARLTEYWGKSPRNVNLLMNRVIKYTGFSINDPKNAAIKDDLQHILLLEEEYKENPDNTDIEKELLAFFGNREVDDSSENTILDFLEEIVDNTPETAISIVRYDEHDNRLGMHTGTFQDITKEIKNYKEYYYRVAVLNQNTVRERVATEHFGVKTSCVGGLSFSVEETLNRYLNRSIQKYKLGDDFDFYYLLCKFQWYVSKLSSLNKNTSEGLECELKKLIKQFPALKEIDNLNDYKKKHGIYVMVLDDYNTLYIGQATDVRQRIMSHWSRSDYFTGTGIDLFKALDTTRIFVLECEIKELNPIEHKMTKLCDGKYSFNVLTGGDWDYHIANNLLLVETYEDADPIGGVLSIFAQVNSFADKFIVRENK